MSKYSRSWLDVAENSDFPLQNIPFGIVRRKDGAINAATRIGDHVIDLHALAKAGHLDGTGLTDPEVFSRNYLNDFIALGKKITNNVRQEIIRLFSEENVALRDDADARNRIITHIDENEPLLPVKVGDYTDFYSSIEHATNVGKMFRDPDNALLPNWKHIPVGYHGRSSSIVVSGTPVRRPFGQTKPKNAESPVFGPTRSLDFELEVAFITQNDTGLGTRIPVGEAEDHIFGLVLFNDLSARDIQKWEYVPLGPFLGKSFGSVVSPWIVTLEALEPFRTKGPAQDPQPLPYLRTEGKKNFDIDLEVSIRPEHAAEEVVCRSNFRYLYWNMAQQLAHQTVNGCNVRTGDMYASGTISGPEPHSFGSLLELTWGGSRPLKFEDSSERTFVLDYDNIIMRGHARKNGPRIGFGECTTMILPAGQ